MTEELSQKQKRFGREYMVDFNVAAAYVRAGYSKNGAQSGGSRLLRDPRIQAYIAELEAEATERAGLTVDGVLKNLREDRDAARAAGQYGPAVRADELLGKYLAMFTDVSKNVVVDDIPPEDAITDLCTQNGIVHETARVLFMQGLEALKTPYHPDDEDPTPPAPTQPAPRMVQ
ncbi:MAG: terminase small subunit [Gemmatimonadetes bacterium]|nr:terminase small subunit [Gemmatimonadota bacterium]